MKLTAKQLAAALNEREYPVEISQYLEDSARESGLVIVYGASDDLTEFCGAIYNERDAYNGATHLIERTGLHEIKCDLGPDCPNYHEPTASEAVPLKAVWHDDDGPSWTFEFPVQHETFQIIEDDQVYCVGIVFAMDDVREYLDEQTKAKREEDTELVRLRERIEELEAENEELMARAQSHSFMR